ncbi:mucin-associated surface protein (MASP) [Trypanosoma cruzi]|nr:mucin-associated surface protein (MASP) [Trypanosoma cruzi]
MRVAAADAFYCAVSFLLLSPCVDGALVCAEGCTQVAGVMAMMTGRVLLVCALCVLWWGTPGGRCDEGGTGGTPPGASASDVVGNGSQESPPIAQGGSHTPGLEAPGIKNKNEDPDDEQLLTEDEEEEEESSDEEDEDEDRDRRLQISGKEGIPTTPPPGGGGGGKSEAAGGKLEKVNEDGPKPEKQHPVESAAQKTSEKETVDAGEAGVNQQNEGSRLKPQENPNPVQEEDTRNGEGHQQTQEKEQQTNVEEITPHNPAGDHSPGEHNGNDGSKEMEEGEEGGVEDHERHRAQEREEAAHVSGAPKVNSADIQQEVQRTHAGGTLTGIKQKTGEEEDDETEEEREQQKEQNQENPPGKEQETKTGANATNQINTTPGDSDSSTAVSHTTSPLLLLLVVVACAAAAAVVAA